LRRWLLTPNKRSRTSSLRSNRAKHTIRSRYRDWNKIWRQLMERTDNWRFRKINTKLITNKWKEMFNSWCNRRSCWRMSGTGKYRNWNSLLSIRGIYSNR
jgi:hypothetical protein